MCVSQEGMSNKSQSAAAGEHFEKLLNLGKKQRQNYEYPELEAVNRIIFKKHSGNTQSLNDLDL